MTVSDYPDEEQYYEAEPVYPTAFGVELTPNVLGIIAAVLGVAASLYLLFRVVIPKISETQALQQEVEQLEVLIQNPEETQREIAEARERLARAEQLQADVLALFANEENLETLLYDLNQRVESVNAGVVDEERRAELVRFEVNEAASGPVQDGSLGESVNNRLERRVYNVELEGNFAQTQSILRNIERLQPLLIVQELDSNLDTAGQTVQIDQQGNVSAGAASPEPRLSTAFRLDALLPASGAPAEAAETAEGAPAEGAQPAQAAEDAENSEAADSAAEETSE
ncbi:MAG: pilus assembly protein PilO [Elainellaceae cyanobacterium]